MDVMDHVDQAIDNIESLDKQSEGLIDLVFNFLSVRTNESMQILAAVSIVFLPITFLSSVFGMVGKERRGKESQGTCTNYPPFSLSPHESTFSQLT